MSDFDLTGRRESFGSSRPKELGEVKLNNPISVDVSSLAKERFAHGKHLKTADEKSEYILDENGRTILLFKGEKPKEFTSIYSPLSKQELRRAILALPEDQQQSLSGMLDLPEPTQEDIQTYESTKLQREKDSDLLNRALKQPPAFPPERTRAEKIDQNLIRGIIQKEYAVTNAKSDKPIIGTYGLGPCIALVVYEPQTKIAAVAHIDATTRVDSIDHIFYDIESGKNAGTENNLTVGLLGGDSSSRKNAIEILKYLEGRGIKVAFADILEKQHPSAFVIDSRDGRIIPNVQPLDSGPEEHLRMQAAGLAMNSPIRKEFDGRK